ncbi:MAG: septum site-determining protein MinC [Chromatiaceae bacterium]|nr:septum site-determining protein MinC [Chromatiaceae bacterium]MCP5313942.1 septum site-determining protein MinC [Chromatiaceae bacterium]
MSEAPARTTSSPAPFDMKAGQFTIPTLVLRDLDTAGLDAFLAQQVARLPSFFDQAPVAIDLSGLNQRDQLEEFPMIVGMLRGHGMIPVGVRGGSEEQKAQALALELAVMPAGRKVSTPQAPAAPREAAQPTSRTLIVDKPVRSGQRIYADAGDLVLLAGVSSGAEIMADGHIHAYGPLRGRAMAGVSGDAGARIFCRELGAELVSIAGRYRVSENLESRFLGRSVQISLSGDALRFELL